MKTKLTLCFISVILCVNIAAAQKLAYGPTLGLINKGEVGSVLLDYVQVGPQRGGDLRYFWGYVSYDFNSEFRLTTGVNYCPDNTSYVVYKIRTDCQFCPLVKAGTLSYASIEVPLLVEYNIPLTRGKFFTIVGVAPSIRLQQKGDEYYLHKDAGQGVSDVIPAMKTVIKPIVWDYSLGVGLNVWRLRFEARYQTNLTNSATNAIKVWDKSSDFIRTHANIRFGAGYNLNWRENP